MIFRYNKKNLENCDGKGVVVTAGRVGQENYGETCHVEVEAPPSLQRCGSCSYNGKTTHACPCADNTEVLLNKIFPTLSNSIFHI